MQSSSSLQKPASGGFLQWARSRKGQKIWLPIVFMIIPLGLLILFTYYPFAEMVRFSFFKMKYTTPVDKRQFVGLKNYIDVFRRKDCFGALKLSLYYVVGALIQLAISLYLATILSFKVRAGKVFKGLMFFPYLINGIAIAISTVLISTNANRPITVGITQFSSFNMIEWQYLFAASLLATIPVVILFMCIEKHLTAGLTSGGVKG